MAAEVRRAKKTFNIVAIKLIENITSIFGPSPKLDFFKAEIERMQKDPKEAHVAAANFFKTMNTPTAIKSSIDGGHVVVVGELIVRNDERLFIPAEIKTSIAALEELGIPEKWPKLNATNKVKMWDFLTRLATLSSQVVMGTQMLAHPELLEVLKSAQTDCEPLKAGATEAEYIEYAKKLENSILGKTKQDGDK